MKAQTCDVEPAEEGVDLSTIMQVDFWQALQDAFSNATGLAAITVNTEKPVSEASNFTDFCMELIRKTPEGYRRCNECDLKGGRRSRETRRHAVYTCHAGLTDIAAPIIVNDEQVGAVIGGQVLTQEPDEDTCRAYARDLGIDPETYVVALRKVPRSAPDRVEAAAQLLYLIAAKMGDTWHQQHIVKQISQTIHSDVEQIRHAINTLHDESVSALDTQKGLEDGLDDIRTTVDMIDGVLKSIRAVSKQTRLLGLNASIEAARAAEYGKGFGIVAQEVRQLSENSSTTVDEIECFTTNIRADTGTVIKAVGTLSSALERQAGSVETLDTICDRIARDSMVISSLVKNDDD